LEQLTELITPSLNDSSSAHLGSSMSIGAPTLPTSATTAAATEVKLGIVAPELQNYMDYRKFLQDWYNHKRVLSRKSLRPYSYAMFSAAADIKSPNYLKMIIEGQRNLSEDMILKFAKAIGANKETTEEFRLLVLFGQASDPAERNFFLKELSEFRVQRQLRSGEISAKSYSKVPNWIGWILYALIDQDGVEFSTEKLRELLRGKASGNEIEDALKTLLNSGEVVQDDITGKLKKARNLVDAPEEIPVALIRKLQSQLMYLGLESLFQDSPAEREFGALTLSLTKQEFEEIKFKLRQMRKQINKDNSIRRMSSSGERVYQMNLQLFPVTESVKK
jgi:uncharacterized protein (TIGR02147 family)